MLGRPARHAGRFPRHRGIPRQFRVGLHHRCRYRGRRRHAVGRV